MTSNCLIIQKYLTSEAKLWYPQQETISYSSIVRNMESIRRKSTRTQNLYRPQKPTALYNYKMVKLTVIAIVSASKIIKVYNILNFRKKKPGSRCAK